MPTRPAVPLTPERSAVIIAEAVRRVDASIPGAVDISVLRRTLETEMAKGPLSLAELMKIGRRRMLDRAAKIDRKARARC